MHVLSFYKTSNWVFILVQVAEHILEARMRKKRRGVTPKKERREFYEQVERFRERIYLEARRKIKRVEIALGKAKKLEN